MVGASGATVSTVQVRVTGVGSVLPLALVARTLNACAPSASAAYSAGELHGAYGAPSRLHSNVDPGWEDESSNAADGLSTTPLGPEVIVVSGAGSTFSSSLGGRVVNSRELTSRPSVDVCFVTK